MSDLTQKSVGSRSAEQEALTAAVDEFSETMKRKLIQKMDEGQSGWRDPECLDGIKISVREHDDRVLYRGDDKQAVDVANLAMMICVQTGRLGPN